MNLFKKCKNCLLETTLSENPGNKCPKCNGKLVVSGEITGKELDKYAEELSENPYYVAFALLQGYSTSQSYLSEHHNNSNFILFMANKQNQEISASLVFAPRKGDKETMLEYFASLITMKGL